LEKNKRLDDRVDIIIINSTFVKDRSTGKRHGGSKGECIRLFIPTVEL